jgi:endogenous inhibitor of DNA gyrase (YacG/DUF329 family)
MTIKKNDIVCPQCGKKNTWVQENKFRPFCSERCKLIDLGDWAAEKHRVPGDPADIPDDNDNGEN